MAINPAALALLNKANKEAGAPVVKMASDIHTPPTFTSGSLWLDLVLGGGWPGNKWAEIYGKESHGKTTIALKTIAANQAKDPDFTTLWVAAEHYDRANAEALGVDTSRVVVISTQAMEYAYQQIIDWSEARACDAVVLDSYGALTPKEEEDKDMDERSVSVGARVTGQFFRKIGFAMERENDERPMMGLFLNQLYTDIGGYARYGTPMETPGGKRKNFAFWQRIEVKRDEYIDEKFPGIEKPVKVGQRIKVTAIKNKSTAPQQVANIDYYFRDAPKHGFKRGEYDLGEEIRRLAFIYEVIEQRGSSYTFRDRKWRGKDAVLASLLEEPDLFAEVEAEIRDVVLSRPA